jgi:hypothetical protein
MILNKGWMVEWMDGWMVGWLDGWTAKIVNLQSFNPPTIY